MNTLPQNNTGDKKMDKSIIRTVKNAENPFVMIDRRIFENDSLSLKAKGLLGYLLSRPDNWTVSMGDLIKRSKDGRDSITSALNELIESGHIVKVEQEREGGKFTSYDYIVYEEPLGENRNGKTDTEKPQRLNRNGKSATNNTNNNKKDFNEREENPPTLEKPNLEIPPQEKIQNQNEFENPTPQETFEFLKNSLAFGSDLGIISEREINLAEITALTAEVTAYWSTKHLTKQQILAKILGSVSRLGMMARIEKYTLSPSQISAQAAAPVTQEPPKPFVPPMKLRTSRSVA